MQLRRTDLTAGRYTSLILLLVLGALWGSSYLFIKVGVGEVPPLTLVGGRLLLSTVLLWILLLASGQPVPRRRAQWGTYAVVGFLSGVLPYTLVAWGEQYISSSLAALLQSTMPMFTVVLAHFLGSGERLTGIKILGVITGFVGVGILLLPDLRQGVQTNVLGQLAVVGSSVSYAASTVFARSRMRGQPPLVSTTGQITMALVFTLPLSLVIDRPFDLSPSWAALGAWIGLAILGTVLAYTIYYALIDRESATFVSTVTYIIPISGLILGALVLGETLSLNLFLSLALILVGVLLVRR
jgi:drug/metabolite transporter (DMT)-like permease